MVLTSAMDHCTARLAQLKCESRQSVARERQSPDWRFASRQSGDWRSRVSIDALHRRIVLYLAAVIASKDFIAGFGDKARHKRDMAYAAKIVINGSIGWR
jgi:hypothetical protein